VFETIRHDLLDARMEDKSHAGRAVEGEPTVMDRRLPAAVLLATAPAAGLLAQEHPFLFSLSTAPAAERSVLVHYDAGVAERGATPLGPEGFEQQVGFQAALGPRWMLAGRAAFNFDRGRSAQSSQQVEVLRRLRVATGRGFELAAGAGYLRDWTGTDVLLARVVVGHRSGASRLHANARFEKPLGAGRDPVDVIVSLGWARRLAPSWAAGVEAIGEDLEGFWEEEEAEGGARLLVGPAVRYAPPGKPFSVLLAGGPIVQATRSGQAGSADRALSRAGRSGGFAVRAALTYAF
jgi:hypothetical protein